MPCTVSIMHSQHNRGSTGPRAICMNQQSTTICNFTLCRHASWQGYGGLGPLLGWEGTFIGVHSLVTLAQVIGEHGVVCCSHSDLVHRLWVVLGAAHIGLDVNLSHRVRLVCGPYLHRKAPASVSPVITDASVQNKENCCIPWHSCLGEVSSGLLVALKRSHVCQPKISCASYAVPTAD